MLESALWHLKKQSLLHTDLQPYPLLAIWVLFLFWTPKCQGTFSLHFLLFWNIHIFSKLHMASCVRVCVKLCDISSHDRLLPVSELKLSVVLCLWQRWNPWQELELTKNSRIALKLNFFTLFSIWKSPCQILGHSCLVLERCKCEGMHTQKNHYLILSSTKYSISPK